MTNYTSNMSVVTSEYDNFYFYSYRLKMADVRAELFKLKSPNSRFMYTRDLLLKHNILMTPLDDDDEYDEYNEYDHPDTSTSYRQNGNVFFKDKLYVKAVEMYTKCLKGCKTNTECYALAQANRSAAYFHTGEYEHCLNDAFSALKSKNYPSKLAYKLYQRMGHAERILGFVEQAKESYALCLERLDEADMSAENKRRFRAEVEKFVTECEKQPTERKRPMETPCVEQLVGGRNENIPALSSFVELKMSESMERGVYATRDINPGDVVAIDEPYIGWPFPECAGVCNFNGCMKINSALIQCPKCKLVSYCNKDCMNKDDKDGHNLECTIIYIIRTTIPGISKINELAMKWFLKDYLKMGLKKYCSIIDNYNFSESKINPITRGFDEIGQYKSDNFLTAYSLVSSKIISTDVSFFFNCIAAHMLHYLVCSGFRIPDCYIGTVGASLVQILTVLDLSYRKLNALSFRRSDILLSRTMALTLYPSISLFNHSCDANISPSGNMFDRIRVMKAIQPIPKGTQLCCTYGIMFIELNKKDRQTFCNYHLNFECYCEPCIKNWPTYNYIPNRLSTLNILNVSMADTVSSECKKFMEFRNSVGPKDHCQHLNYLYSFIKLLYTNVKRPFALYEDCLEMISNAHCISTNEYLRAMNIS